jgi:hypothetical protein
VRKSSDSGATWNTVSNYNLAAGPFDASAHAITTDSAGNIYAAGQAYDASNISHWIVRKSTDGGTTWNTVNNYQLSNSSEASANAIGIDGGGNIYAAGQAYDSYLVYHWIVRKSTDGGTTWNTVSDYQRYTNFDSVATALGVDAHGNIYAAGYTTNASGIPSWVVRKSSDGGATWTTVNLYSDHANSSAVTALGADSLGNIYVVGYSYDASNTQHWIVRKSANAGGSWTTIDDRQGLSQGQTSSANAIIPCLNQQICVAGQMHDDPTKTSRFHLRILSQ